MGGLWCPMVEERRRHGRGRFSEEGPLPSTYSQISYWTTGSAHFVCTGGIDTQLEMSDVDWLSLALCGRHRESTTIVLYLGFPPAEMRLPSKSIKFIHSF